MIFKETSVWKTAAATALVVMSTASAASAGDRPCDLKYVAGEWVFITDVGRQALFPDAGDPTAMGTFNIGKDGSLSGTFDATFEGFMHLPDIPFNGTVTVGDDCRGTVEFVTGAGSARTDSLVVINGNEMRGMSQDINNLWTYTIRRIERHPGAAVRGAKMDALLKRLGLVPSAFDEE